MDQQKIGEFLKTLRKEKNMTQSRLAERFGVSDRTVSRWENGVNMPDLSLLVELADFYDVDIREIIDGERKSENMDVETKETLLKVSDYASAEKKSVVKKTKIRLIAAVAGSIVFILFVCAALNFFFGNPVSKRLAINNAETILNLRFNGEGYKVTGAGYWIEDMEYFVKAENENSPDTSFYMNFGMFGNYRYDNYSEVIEQKRVVVDRLNREYNDLVCSVDGLNAIENISFVYGEILTAPYDDEEGVTMPEGFEPVERDSLSFDQTFDLKKMGASAGHICVEISSDDLSPQNLAQTLLKIKEACDKAGVSFFMISLSLVDRAAGPQGNGVAIAAVRYFPYADIEPEGVLRSVNNAITP